MPRTARNHEVVARAQAHPRTIFVLELSLTLEQDDPLVAVLLEPHSRRRRMPRRDDPLDRDSFSGSHLLDELRSEIPE